MTSLQNFNHQFEGTDFSFTHSVLKREHVKEAFTHIVGEKRDIVSHATAKWIKNMPIAKGEEEVIQSLFTHLFALEQQYDTMKEEFYALQEKTTTYKEKAYLCGLTRSLNRNFFMEFLDAFELRRKPKAELSTYFFYMDLVKFKNINDTYGHEVGDQILVEFSKRLANVVRSEDCRSFDIEKLITKNFIARIGGDEFIGKIELSSEEDAAKLKTRIQDSMKTPFKTCAGLLQVGVSVGYQQIKSDLNVKEVIKEADRKMYEDKRK